MFKETQGSNRKYPIVHMDTFHRLTLLIIHELWLKPVTSHADTVTLSILPGNGPHQTPPKKRTQQMCRRSGDAQMDAFYTFTGPQNHMSNSTYKSRKLTGLSNFHTESGICFSCMCICLRVCGFWPCGCYVNISLLVLLNAHQTLTNSKVKRIHHRIFRR